MSIYIPGMEMPSGCEGCFFLLDCGICSMLMAANCTHKSVGDYRWEENERHPDCPLIEVPEHGDLIDAMKEMRLMQSYDYDTYDDYMRAFDMLDNAETIIPADPEKDGDAK